MKTVPEYERDAAEIYRRSFAIVRDEADLGALPAGLEAIAVRLIHACGMVDIVSDLAFTPAIVDGCRAALNAGAPVICDCEMVAAGVIRRSLPADNQVLVTLNDARVPDFARQLATTRSAAAVTLWKEHLAGAVVAIGNAPTALFHLLARLEEGWPRPAGILAFPVGFVGAAESKETLCSGAFAVPYLTLRGRRGGSAMASAAVNALAAAAGEAAK